MKIGYQITKPAADAIFIATGTRPSLNRFLEIDETTLTPDQRKLLVATNAFGSVTLYDYSFVPGSETLFGISPASSRKSPMIFDGEITISNIFMHLQHMQEEKAAVDAQVIAANVDFEQRKAAWKAAREAERKAQMEARIAEENARKATEEAKRQQAMIISWNDAGMFIGNLSDCIFAASGLEIDTRFKSWIKDVIAIDASQPNGYSFVGDFVANHTIESRRGQKHVYLVASESGSRRHQTTTYTVVTMDEDGILHKTDIVTDNTDAGWALRIRVSVAALLE